MDAMALIKDAVTTMFNELSSLAVEAAYKRRVTSGSYDPATDSITTTESSTTVDAFDMKNVEEKDSTTGVISIKHRVLIKASALSFEPDPEHDELVISSVRYKIKSCELDPSGSSWLLEISEG